jgi:hypothetical protein
MIKCYKQKLPKTKVESEHPHLKQHTKWLRLCQECTLQESYPQLWVFPNLQCHINQRQRKNELPYDEQLVYYENSYLLADKTR